MFESQLSKSREKVPGVSNGRPLDCDMERPGSADMVDFNTTMEGLVCGLESNLGKEIIEGASATKGDVIVFEDNSSVKVPC